MAYSRPGVYISERLLPAPIAAGVTANAAGAVVASFAQGPEAVTLVTSWYEFTKYFGFMRNRLVNWLINLKSKLKSDFCKCMRILNLSRLPSNCL